MMVTPSLPLRGRHPKGSTPLDPHVGSFCQHFEIIANQGCATRGGRIKKCWSPQKRSFSLGGFLQNKIFLKKSNRVPE